MIRLALLSLTLLATPASAESVLFKCFFDWSCDPNRKCQNAGLDVRFRVDTDTNGVTRLGGDPLVTPSMIFGDRAITILEEPISGGLATTTIMLNSGEAVRSENLITGRLLTPMQYLGSCQTF
jgi:hypothetical protein